MLFLLVSRLGFFFSKSHLDLKLNHYFCFKELEPVLICLGLDFVLGCSLDLKLRKQKTLICLLKKSSDFEILKTEGKRVHCAPWLTLNYNYVDSDRLRYGFTISRKVGSAVVRNRLKRLGREFFRKGIVTGGFDVNLVFRPMPEGFYVDLCYKELELALSQGLKKVERNKRVTGSSGSL